jgi:hypothetical protein
MRKIALISLLGMTLAVPCSSVAAEVDWTAVDKALGRRPPFRGTFIVTVSPAPI